MSQSSNTKNLHILSRVDTKENWESVNPVLLDREIGYERNTGRYKIGDGLNAWNDLEYATEYLDEQIEITDLKVDNLNNQITELDAATVKKSGDTMNGVLKTGNGTYNGYGSIASNNQHLNLVITGNENAEVDEKTRYLSLHNTDEANLEGALTLHDNNIGDSYKIYGEHNKPTALEIGTLKIYNNFPALNTELGTSFNIATPIEDIIQAMPNATGLKADINTVDGSITSDTDIYPCVYGMLSIYKMRDNRVEVEYVSNTAVDSSDYNKRWIGQYNAGVFGGFIEVLHTDNYNPDFETKRFFLNASWSDGIQAVMSGHGKYIYDFRTLYPNATYDLKIKLDVEYLLTYGWDTTAYKDAFQDLELYSFGNQNVLTVLGEIDTTKTIPILVTVTKNIL